jgi:hypothetical protein
VIEQLETRRYVLRTTRFLRRGCNVLRVLAEFESGTYYDPVNEVT